MNWKTKTKENEPSSIGWEKWAQTHTLNEFTWIKIIQYKENRSLNGEGQSFSIRTSPNLYATLRTIPLLEDEAYSFNDIATTSRERAFEIVDALKVKVALVEQLELVEIFLNEGNNEKYERGEMVNASFYPTSCYSSLRPVPYQEINQAMQNNTMVSVLKDGWTEEELDEYYDNF